MEKRILVVDDEVDLCDILQFNLCAAGYSVDVASSGEEALERDLSAYDLLLLDVMMGELSGFDVARILRQRTETCALPIIFLTACTAEDDVLAGFDAGGDDYIKKPFSVKEVVARVKSVLARTAHTETLPPSIVFGTLEMRLDCKRVFLDGAEIPFTKKEFGILRFLLEHRNQMFAREEILSQVWGKGVYVLDRTVDVNIARIRKKLGRYGQNIVSRSGFGYAFND